MSFLRTSLFSLIFVASSLLGCESPGGIEIGESNDSSTGILTTPTGIRTTTLPTKSTYYIARHDTRRCPAPRCGGFFVSAVNQRVTLCADGLHSDECYVYKLDYSSFDGLPGAEKIVRDVMGTDFETTRVILLGKMQGRILGSSIFQVQMAWTAIDTLPITGDFYDTRVNGIVCVVAPCPSFDQELLNRGTTAAFHGIDFGDVPAHATDSTYTSPALQSSYGLIVAGENVIYDHYGPGGAATILKASQAFIPTDIRPGRITRAGDPPSPSPSPSPAPSSSSY